jgi:hypothetical protein
MNHQQKRNQPSPRNLTAANDEVKCECDCRAAHFVLEDVACITVEKRPF